MWREQVAAALFGLMRGASFGASDLLFGLFGATLHTEVTEMFPATALWSRAAGVVAVCGFALWTARAVSRRRRRQ